jgi:hypothetical protein
VTTTTARITPATISAALGRRRGRAGRGAGGWYDSRAVRSMRGTGTVSLPSGSVFGSASDSGSCRESGAVTGTANVAVASSLSSVPSPSSAAAIASALS